jgi:hypothetical protein
MAMDQPPSERPAEPQSGGGTDPVAQERSSRSELRQMTGALAAELPPASLPSAPVSVEEVRELAADLAAELLHQIVQSGSASGSDEVQGLALRRSFNCTGATFSCNGYYDCPGLGKHSCTGSFSCGTTFRCTLVFSGLSVRATLE